MVERKLTPKQQRFGEEYLIDLNASQAALRAGYSKRNYGDIAMQLLRKTHVSAAIAAKRRAVTERSVVTQQRIIDEMAKIGFSDVRRMFDPDGRLRPAEEWDDDTAGAVAGFDTSTFTRGRGEDAELETIKKIRLWDKPAALIKLGQHLGMFTERIKLDGVEELLGALAQAAKRVAKHGEEDDGYTQLEGPQ